MPIKKTSISIVMPSFNQRRFLSEAVESVLSQDVDLELLVFDPGSSDGSRDYLASVAQAHPDRVRLFFESDRGQSDAVNKGMALARGRIQGWLNSDDRLRPGALARVADAMPQGAAWLYGLAGMIDGSSRDSSSLITAYKNYRAKRFSRFKLLQENFISQMAVFWTRELWDAAGGLRLDKHLDMDYDLWLRFAAERAPVTIPCELADFRVHEAAKGSLQAQAQLQAAFVTATENAKALGIKGRVALGIHRALSARTQLAYKFLKPR